MTILWVKWEFRGKYLAIGLTRFLQRRQGVHHGLDWKLGSPDQRNNTYRGPGLKTRSLCQKCEKCISEHHDPQCWNPEKSKPLKSKILKYQNSKIYSSVTVIVQLFKRHLFKFWKSICLMVLWRNRFSKKYIYDYAKNL